MYYNCISYAQKVKWRSKQYKSQKQSSRHENYNDRCETSRLDTAEEKMNKSGIGGIEIETIQHETQS